jgi:hypothetical protein
MEVLNIKQPFKILHFGEQTAVTIAVPFGELTVEPSHGIMKMGSKQ